MSIKLTITNETVDAYCAHYFTQHPRARKRPIEHPYHPSINVWFILPRLQLNALKQKWKDFTVWWLNDIGLANKKIEKCKMRFVSYYPTKRRVDCDNQIPKFILDGMVESGFIVDDDSHHLTSLTIECGYNKENPCTEIYIDILQ
jgi:Holliday junction resolvase RusA-like endonuclease